jgi:hypothetical protein
MNRSLWRRLVTCLLLLALPVQGVVAAGMPTCDFGHHDTAHRAGVVVPGGADGIEARRAHAHVHDAGAHPAHDRPAVTVALDEGSDVDPPAPGAPVADCGTCGSCCSSTMASGAVASPLAPSGDATASPSDPGYRSIELGVFERPPQRASI